MAGAAPSNPSSTPVAHPLDGTENAQFPFWSPDSKAIGFFADRKLKRIDGAGGPAVAIADAPFPRGGAWAPDGTIVYSPTNPGGLQKVSAAGGMPSPATVFDTRNDRSHRFPWFLPDGRHFLFEDQLQLGSNDDVLRIASLDSKEVKTIGPSNSNAMYTQGHLVFLRDNTLIAQPFDEIRLVTTGDAEPIAEGVQTAVPAGSVGVFCVSRDGLLVYQSGSGGTGMQLTWFDRPGKPMGTLGEAGNVFSMHFSPDRKNVAVVLVGQTSDLWIYDTFPIRSSPNVAKLRQIEVLMSQGKTVPLACKEAGIVDQTFYRWRREYGGLQLEQAKKLKDLQKENAQLRRAVADLTVEKQILKDIAGGNF